jgi:hypothetical protein
MLSAGVSSRLMPPGPVPSTIVPRVKAPEPDRVSTPRRVTSGASTENSSP